MKRSIPDIRKFLSTRDIVPKIICLFLSIILWTIVNSTKVGEVKFTIPVELKNLPDNLAVLEGLNKNTTVTLTGRKDLLKSVNIKNINAVVNLENPEVGFTRKYPVGVLKNGIPDSIELSLSSNELVLTVEKKIQKRVRIVPNIKQPAKNQYAVGNVRVDPPYILISGPESQLKDMDSIRTNLIVLGDAVGRIEKEISIDGSSISNIKVDIKKARVIIPVFDTSGLIKFEIMIDIKNPKEGYKYILNRQNVSIYLRAKDDVKPEKDDVSAFVDAASIRYDYLFRDLNVNYIEKDYMINIKLKDDVFEVVSVIPDSISVKIVRQ